MLIKRRQEEALRERRMKEIKEDLVQSQNSLQAALLERDARKNELVSRIKESKVLPAALFCWNLIVKYDSLGISLSRET